LSLDGFDVLVRQALEKLGHRLTSFAVPGNGWTVAATIERRRLHGESAGY